MPPNLEELRRRLIKRGNGNAATDRSSRCHNAAREMELWRDYRYTIISQSMEEDLQKFRHIMGAERYLSRRLVLSLNEIRRTAISQRRKVSRNERSVLGVTGSIAAYKSAELASLLVKQGHEFRRHDQDATEFITPLTLQTLSKNPVTTSFYDEKETGVRVTSSWPIAPIFLLIAPATANMIAELAHGLGRTSAGRDRSRDSRADFARAGDERKNVGTSRDPTKRDDVEIAWRRIHRSGRRNARVRLRRRRAIVESG